MSSFSLLEFLYKQFFVTPVYPKQDLTGKTYIITGANTGLGKEAARHLVRLKAKKVIITSRDASKGAAAKADIEKSTGRQGVLEVWPLDLQDYDSVRAFAKRVAGLDRVDGVLENAAKATGKWEIVNGHESTITVNVISTLYLGLLLLPILRESARKHDILPVLSTVSSEVHFMTPFEERKSASIFQKMDDKETADIDGRYPLSKIVQVFGSREIAKRAPLEQDHVVINFLNPGLCHSELGRELKTWAWWIQTQILARSTEVGSRTLVNGVLSGPETHGKYLDCCRVTPCAKLVEGDEGPALQARVWSELSAELEKIQPGVLKNLEA